MVRQSQRKKAALPERFRNGEDQEASSASEPAAPTPTTPAPVASTSSTAPQPTPSYSTSSSSSFSPGSPSPTVRRAGKLWREKTRAGLPSRVESTGALEQRNLAPPASIAAAQAAFMPVRKPEDEYDVDSPYFGLNHTPEWDGLGIDIDDQTQERWFPPGLMAPPSYDSLSSAAKFMLFHELTKKMTFKDLVAYLDLTINQLDDFGELYHLETSRDVQEDRLNKVAMARLDAIHKTENRLVTYEDFDLALKEEVDQKLPPTVLESPIPLLDIGKAIAFLQTCHGSQMSGSQSNNGQRSNNVVLSLSDVNEVIEEMRKYSRLGLTVHWDFSHDLGFKDYVNSEPSLASVAQRIDLSEREAEKPAQPPIGRPKKRGKHFANKPLRNKSDLLKMVLPSKLQQMESVGDEAEKKAEGSGLNKGKGRGN